MSKNNGKTILHQNKEIFIEHFTIEEFSEKFGTTNTNLCSDEFLDELEENGGGMYYVDGDFVSIFKSWDEEFDGERGRIADNVDIYCVDGMHIGLWNW